MSRISLEDDVLINSDPQRKLFRSPKASSTIRDNLERDTIEQQPNVFEPSPQLPSSFAEDFQHDTFKEQPNVCESDFSSHTFSQRTPHDSFSTENLESKQQNDPNPKEEDIQRHWFQDFEKNKCNNKAASSSSDSDLWDSDTDKEHEDIKNLKEEDNKNEIVKEMNAVLKTIPSSFQMSIPFKEISPFCKRETVTLHSLKKGSKTISKLVFVPKSGHNVIGNYFKLKNPYCTLSFTKKKIRQDFELKKDLLNRKHQIVLYAKCNNKSCKGSFCFKIHRVPADAEWVIVKFRYVFINSNRNKQNKLIFTCIILLAN